MLLLKMDHNENCITFIWKIKNIYLCGYDFTTIFSPFFFVPEFQGTHWYLCFSPNDSVSENCFVCSLFGDIQDSSKQFELDYELSILATDGSVQQSELFVEKLYLKDYLDHSVMYIKREELFLPKADPFNLDDSLTIRCRMWNRQNLISLSGIYFAETILKAKSESAEGKIDNVSQLKPRGKYQIMMFYPSRKTVFSAFNLCIAADGNLAVEMHFNKHSIYKYKIFLEDIFGNKVKCGQGEIYDSKQHCAPLTISKEHLIKNKWYFLSDDVLTIQCEVIFRICAPKKEIIKIEYGLNEKQHIENATMLNHDLTSMLKEVVLCDTELKTGTETFPAHKAILSARSPVFKSMFSIDMKENAHNCVNIDDLDADTVRRMLLFMYSGNLDDLEYECAKNLYFAADKYNIISLFQTCSNIMKQNLLLSNCCDILLLSDIHQDKYLKTATQDFITENDKAVLFSEEWKNLEKNHPQLIIEVLRTVWMKNRRG